MGGCSASGPSRVNLVSFCMQNAYKYLGFTDENQNGIIEKSSFWNGRKNEGYIEEADINGDGKIVAAEVKYYLQNMEEVSDELKQEYALMRDEEETVLRLKLGAARTFDPPNVRAAAICDIAVEMWDAGMDEDKVIAVIDEALETAHNIWEPYNPGLKPSTLCDIAIKMSEAGMDSQYVSEMFNETLDALRAIKYTPLPVTKEVYRRRRHL